jgi:hypothetical protein
MEKYLENVILHHQKNQENTFCTYKATDKEK